MAILKFTGFEAGTATVASENEVVTGTGMSYSSTTVRTGSYSLRCNSTAANNGYQTIRTYAASGAAANMNDATIYVTFYFRYATKPSSANEPIFAAYTGATLKSEVRITSAGNLQIYNTLNAQMGSDGATTLSADTWYRLDIKIGTGASGAYEVKINGTSELSGTGNLDTGNNQTVRLGKHANRNSNTVDFFYDDVVVDNAAFISGDPAVKILPVTGNGGTMTWTGGTGSSNYLEVDEIPISDTDYVMSPTTGAPNDARFALDSCANVGISGTISGVTVSTRTREDTTVTSATAAAKIWSSASTSATTNLNGSTSFTPRALLSLTDPATGSAWTTSGLDAMEAGSTENNNVAVRLSTVMVSVLYVPSSGSSIGTVQGLTYSSVGTVQGLAKASVGTIQGLA